ncbi:MAG: phosphotransferase [Clostridiales bacterium]|nr:phosphotransferase [Clostridiales bacterium]
MSNKNTAKRLGGELVDKIKALISDNVHLLDEIDNIKSMIHNDFRPANMIIDDKYNVYYVDWEFATYGHSLADIGQFSRYSSLFDDEDVKNFEQTYNSYANRKLPKNWHSLCKLRDLVNPLQMLGSEADKPIMYEDLKKIVEDTMKYFKHANL